MLRRSARALSLWFILPAALASSAWANPPDDPGHDDTGADWEEGEAGDGSGGATCPLLDQAAPSPGDDPEVELVKVKPATATNLSALEKAILEETNLLRKNPPAYAEKLIRLRPSYQGKLIHRPGQPSILTQEGVSALDEAIDALERAPKRLSRLAHADGLSRAARDHARDLGRTGSLGHTGSDGSGPDVRARRHGTWDGLVAENIAFGPTDAEEIVIGLLVDDGVKDRGHREVLLTRDLYFAGVACGPHPGYGTTCVMTYATSFKTRGEAAAEAPPAALPPTDDLGDAPVVGDDGEADDDRDEPTVRPAPDPWRSPKGDDPADLGVYSDGEDDTDDERDAEPDPRDAPRADAPTDRDDAPDEDDAYSYEPPPAPRVVSPAPGPYYHPGPGYYPGPRHYGPRYYGPRHYGPRYYPGPRYYYGPRYRPYR